MNSLTNASIISNLTESNSTLPDEVNITATTPLGNNLALDLTGNQSIFNYIVGLLGIVLNAYVITVVVFNKSMHKHLTNIYIVNQSIIDSLASAFFILHTLFSSGQIVDQYQPGNIADEALCRLWYSQIPQWGLMDASTYNIVALTFERYLAIVHPIWHKTKFSNNKRAVGLSIGFVWFIGIAFNCAYLIPSSSISSAGVCTIYNYPGQWAQFATGISISLFELFIPIILIILGYSAIAWSLQKRSKISSYQEGGEGVQGKQNNKEQINEGMVKARRNVLQTSALIALFFIICWSPNEIFFLAQNLNSPCCQDMQSWYDLISIALIPLQCCANPIIYTLTYTEFKKGVVNLFTRMQRSVATAGAITSSSEKT